MRAAGVLLAVAATAVSASSCGLLDGIFGLNEYTKDELCAARDALDAQAAQCRSAPPPTAPTSCDIPCSNDSKCHTESTAFVTCVTAPHDCSEVAGGAGGFCAGPLDALTTCAGNNNCGGGGGPTPCDNDGACEVDAGENTQNCPRDCTGPCNNNSFCDVGEGPDCLDCGGACNSDGRCDPNETAAACVDCQPGCNNNGLCDAKEDNVTCPVDCTEGPCNHDFTCDGAEVPVCGDCSVKCNGDGDCPSAICMDLNGGACSAGNVNCSTALPRTATCHPVCNRDSECSAGGDLDCIPDPVNPDRRGCESARCSSDAECGGNFVCATPLELTQAHTPDLGRGGLCLDRCDPIACTFGGGCACGTPPAPPRCGAVSDTAGAVVDFACSIDGPAPQDTACLIDTDCRSNAACFGVAPDRACRSYCHVGGGDCVAPSPTCQALNAAVGVCVP